MDFSGGGRYRYACERLKSTDIIGQPIFQSGSDLYKCVFKNAAHPSVHVFQFQHAGNTEDKLPEDPLPSALCGRRLSVCV